MSGESVFRTLVLTGALLAGCSLLAPGDDEYLGGSGDGSDASTTGGGGTANAGGTGGSGGTAAVSGSAGAGGADGGSGGTGATGGAAGSSGGGGTGGVTCTPLSTAATPQTVALYTIVDRTNTIPFFLWQDVRQGVAQFVDASTSIGVEMGLQYLPVSSNCLAFDYETPLIPILPLPGNANAIKQSLSATNTVGIGTVMQAALTGGITHCKAFATANPNTQCNLVLITDWNGTGCSANLLQIAQAGLATSPSVLTYVVSIDGPPSNNLNTIAAGGGTESPLVATNTDAIANALTTATRRCWYDLPNVGTGTLGVSFDNTALTEVASAGDCSGPLGNQYYLSAGSIVLCPDTCMQATAASAVNVDVTCPP